MPSSHHAPDAGRAAQDAAGIPDPGPRLSFLVLRRGSAPFDDALLALSADTQREVSGTEYEVVVIDGPDADRRTDAGPRDPPRNPSIPEGFRRVRVGAAGSSTVELLNAGLAAARSGIVGLMVDGPRLVTPRVVRFALDAFALGEHVLVTLPDYELLSTSNEGRAGAPSRRGDETDAEGRRRSGYRLLETAVPAGIASHGAPSEPSILELPARPGCMFLTAGRLAEHLARETRPQTGDPAPPDTHAFPSPRRLLLDDPGLRWILLAGEGAVRVVAPGSDPAREGGIAEAEGVGPRPEHDSGRIVTDVRPFVLGAVPGPALGHLEAAARSAGEPSSAGARPAAAPPPTVFVPPSLRRFEPWRAPREGWSEAPTLAYDLVEALRPKVLVAVGVHWGAEYLAYCQSVLEHRLGTICHAVGAWEDRDGPGSGEAMMHGLRDQIRHRHPGFAYILRMPSREAAAQFSDGTVGLVHLDAAIPEADVVEELERWHQKLAPGGVLVCCDVGGPGSARRDIWDELTLDGEAFLFDGSPTLGLLRTRGRSTPGGEPPLLECLFGSDPEDHARLCRAYARIARYVGLRHATDLSEYGQARRHRDASTGAVAGPDSS